MNIVKEIEKLKYQAEVDCKESGGDMELRSVIDTYEIVLLLVNQSQKEKQELVDIIKNLCKSIEDFNNLGRDPFQSLKIMNEAFCNVDKAKQLIKKYEEE
jgi:hypothetical protein